MRRRGRLRRTASRRGATAGTGRRSRARTAARRSRAFGGAGRSRGPRRARRLPRGCARRRRAAAAAGRPARASDRLDGIRSSAECAGCRGQRYRAACVRRARRSSAHFARERGDRRQDHPRARHGECADRRCLSSRPRGRQSNARRPPKSRGVSGGGTRYRRRRGRRFGHRRAIFDRQAQRAASPRRRAARTLLGRRCDKSARDREP